MAAKRLTDLLNFLTSLGTVVSDDDPDKKDKQKALLRGCLVDFKTGPPIEVQEGTNMLEEVKNAKFPQWMRDEVAGAVQEKIMADMLGEHEKKKRSCMQRNLHLYNYLTTGEWNDLCSSCTSFESKMRLIGKRFQLLGLVNPSEPTFVLANILLQLSFCQGNPDKIDEKKHYATLKDLKLVVKGICKRTSHSGVAVYPEDPTTLGSIWEKTYAEDPPAKCPFDVTVVMDLIDGLPARCSHRSVRPGKSKGFQRDEGLQHMLANFLLANAFQGGQQEMGALCNLQFNQPSRKRPLALMNKPDEPVDAPPKTPESPLESPKESKDTAPPRSQLKPRTWITWQKKSKNSWKPTRRKTDHHRPASLQTKRTKLLKLRTRRRLQVHMARRFPAKARHSQGQERQPQKKLRRLPSTLAPNRVRGG